MARYLIGNIKGPAGEDGFSPSASVVQTNTGATITITDANGTTTANIRNGVDGDGNNIDLSPYATKEDLTIMGASISAAGYATEDYVENAVQNINIPVQSVNGMVGDVVVAIPDISDLATEDYVDAAVANVNVDLTGYATEQYVANAIADVNGFSGDYDDLTNKPDLSDMVHTSDLADVALTGSFTDLLNVPDIPAAQVNADWNAAGGKAQILNKPTIPAADGTTIVNNNGVWSAVGGGSSFSGDYDDLINKPDLSVYATNSALAAKQDTLTAGTNITIDANNVISSTGGSNYGDADVAEYIADTFGMGFSDETRFNTIMAESVDSNTKTVPQSLNLPALNLEIKMEDVQAEPICQYIGGLNRDFENNVATLVIDDVFELSVPIDSSGNQSGDGTITFNSNYVGVGASFVINNMVNQTVATPLGTSFIPIDNNTIRVNGDGKLEAQSSGGGTTYTAGEGIQIDNNNEISLDTDIVPLKADLAYKQDVLTAGTGISISSNTVSIDNTVALKSDIPPVNTYGDSDVGDYISNAFGMRLYQQESQPTLWGQTSDPQYIGEDSTAEITLTGSGSSDPFQGGGNTQYPVDFEIRQNSNDELVSSVNDTFLSHFTGSDYSPVYHFYSEDGNKSFDLGYYSDAWWLSETTVSGYSQGYHVSNFNLYLPGETQVIRAPLYEAYIPSSIARVSDIPSGGSTYTAGNGISIENDKISIDENVVATKSEIPVSYGDSDVSSYLQYHFGLYDGSSTTDSNSSNYPVDSTGTLTITSGWTPDPNVQLDLFGDDGNGNGIGICGFNLEYNNNTNLYEASAPVKNYSNFTVEYNENTGETTLNYDWEYCNDNGIALLHFSQWVTIESYDTLNEKYIPNTIARVADLEDELPDYTNASAGDVLAVDSNGGLEWTTPSGGGGSSDAVHLNSWFTSTDWEPVAQQIKNAYDNNINYSLLPSIIISRGYAFTLSYIANFDSTGNPIQITYVQNSSNPNNRYSSGFTQMQLGLLYICFEVSKSDGSISAFYRPYGSGTVITSSMVDTGLTFSNNYLQVNTNVIARKQDVPTTSTNAVSAIYLKDTNNVKYKIEVDTNGNLTATAVSNS